MAPSDRSTAVIAEIDIINPFVLFLRQGRIQFDETL